jgi:CheY-like chemotaxis protein
MSRILLADDSRNAQRMGEQILREEGCEVVTVSDGETALIRLTDVDPDLVMADVFLPQKSGYELCHHIKSDARHRHTRVVLLAGTLERVDEAEAERAQADGILKKPFEASVVVATIRPLLEAARLAREVLGEGPAAPAPVEETAPVPAAVAAPAQPPAEVQIDPERVRAAVTIALDQAMPAMIDEVTARVLVALGKP